ncbi:uncharacterized protein [Euwallacea similis]|uniref:uncharacterized protein n=1 Tax=Euwallacea similis TaxID=1736056 RepID=UPI00345010CF
MRAIFPTILLFGIVNAGVQICFERTQFSLHNNTDVSSEQVEPFLQRAATELRQTLKSELDTWTDFPYTDYHINWHHAALTIAGNFTDGLVSIGHPGIQYFTLVPGGFEIFNLTLPFIYINGSYDIYGYVGKNRLFDIFGNGPFELEMLDFSVAVTSGLRINRSSLCIPLEINFYLVDCTNTFVNFMGGDDELGQLLNKVIQDITPDAVRIISREILDFFDPAIQQIIDNILHTNKMPNFIQLLGLLTEDTDTLRTFLEKPRMKDFEAL